MNAIKIERGARNLDLILQAQSENEEERRTAADALRYGLAALDGNDIEDDTQQK